MKRLFCLFAAVLMLSSVLAGCKDPVQEQTVACQELTLILPSDYVNQINEPFAEDLDFLCGHGTEAVLAFKQERAPLEEVFPELNAETFAQMFLQKAGLDVEVKADENLVTFTYAAEADGTGVTYLSGVYMTEQNFWIVQFYCPTENFSSRQADFLRYLAAITH